MREHMWIHDDNVDKNVISADENVISRDPGVRSLEGASIRPLVSVNSSTSA